MKYDMVLVWETRYFLKIKVGVVLMVCCKIWEHPLIIVNLTRTCLSGEGDVAI